jgi:hypothetical protein
MQSGFKISIGSIMLFIIVVALQLVLFQGVWWIVMAPPITILVLTLNLGLFFLLVRPPALEPRIVGMLLGGLAAFLIIMMLFLSEGQNVPRPTPFRRWRMGPAGPIGKLVDNALVSWLTRLPDQQSPTATVLWFILVNLNLIESVLLDLLGLALIWAGGWVESRLRCRWVRPRAPGLTVLPPLDDRAATPL